MARFHPDEQRLRDLDRLIQVQYDKLRVFEERLAITASAPEQFHIQQLIKNDVLPLLRTHEAEYADLLAASARVSGIPEVKAQEFVDQTLRAVQSLEANPKGASSDELLGLIKQLKEGLQQAPNSASAKLKLTLPIIPLIASYDIELQTGGLAMKAWKNIRAYLTRIVLPPLPKPVTRSNSYDDGLPKVYHKFRLPSLCQSRQGIFRRCPKMPAIARIYYPRSSRSSSIEERGRFSDPRSLYSPLLYRPPSSLGNLTSAA